MIATKYLPGKYNYQWFIVFVVSSVLIFIFLLGTRVSVLQKPLDFQFGLGMLLLALGISFMINLAGYLGLRLFWAGGTIGLFAGMSAMIYFYAKDQGWSDLIGPIVFMEMILAGLGVGLVVELIGYILRKQKRS